MDYKVNEEYAEALVEFGFERKDENSYTVHFKQISTGESIYLAKSKKRKNKTAIIHPGYKYAIGMLDLNDQLHLAEQDEYFYHDSSLSEFPKRFRKKEIKYPSHYGIGISIEKLSAVEAFCEFISATLCKSELQIDLDEINDNSKKLSATDIQALVLARRGHGPWKESLREHCGCCFLTGCTIEKLLIGSHIKPWSQSTDVERLDSFNGLLLRADVDALFDAGLVTFMDGGEIKVSSGISEKEYKMLPFDLDLRIKILNSKHLPYLEFHRKYVFR
ncbi:HNH endonuclease [Granulosicoccus antarcticus]|uniref:HNH nuclease domain-containing protein n=1 Tax=Granulosicoccus antarcticus IMCC3135 TaxID=1192854 RepID=A0A2Z2P466_9GAMM|nr:HNH endonuclease signature motif containing protein [Granulosicoccus antarcticus]ASJ76210.1 hypothetical protein IMCC3135_30805 [Granulosicoccus antarcticus IMCC3135]